MTLSLLVIRCKDIEASKNFYESFGLSFVEEKHGDGPLHYASEYNGCVFELYPNKGQAPQDNNRLGFNVSNVANIINTLAVTDTYEFEGKTIHVFTDPDGRKVEASEK